MDDDFSLSDKSINFDPEEIKPNGNMKEKRPNTIRISTFNPNGLPIKKLKPQLMYCEEEHVDIQCFSEINQNIIDPRQRKKCRDSVRLIDRSAKDVWANTDLLMDTEYKSGGAGMVSFKSVSGCIKTNGYDQRERWTYQVFDSGSNFHSVVFSIYRCSRISLSTSKKTAYRQQRILQAELGQRGSKLKNF